MPSTKSSWLILILLSIVWGSSFILIKKALIALSPMQLASLRLTFAAMAFAPFFWKESRNVGRREWILLALVGLAGSGFPAFCYALAQTKIASSTTGILNSLTPLFTLLIGIGIFQVKSSWSKWIGVALGLIGAVILIAPTSSQEHASTPYAAFIILGSICYAVSGNLIKQYFPNRSAFSISTLAFTLLGPAALILLLNTNIVTVIQNDTYAWYSIGAVLLLAIAGTALASIFYFKLVQDTDALFASSVSYLIPVVAIILGALDGEDLHLYHVFGLLLISSGIYLSRR
ncbi:MAG: DMT family transporter [Saprospiraceae bacterium]|nr:DMT family transporter [Saprospiraceae bacterium]